MKVVYVDVDDTLIRSFGSKRIPMSASLAVVRQLHEAGACLYCWSSGGAEYARSAAAEVGLEDCFQGFLPKPQLLLDDVEFAKWGVVELHPNQCSGRSGQEILGGD
ncbi:hydrolase [bacterium]|nr:hydrolase [bacterium]